jgi:polyisoprenoid-binding protein YceI
MPTEHTLGPDDGRLTIRTGRAGAAAKAGHDLVIEVTGWKAKVALGEQPSDARVEVTVDSRSLRVREGHGGMKALGDDDKDNIRQTIDDEVLKGTPIAFRSTSVASGSGPGELAITGELSLSGTSRPVTFVLTPGADGIVTAAAAIKQSDWGMKPYSALFGTLKVADEVQLEFSGRLPAG